MSVARTGPCHTFRRLRVLGIPDGEEVAGGVSTAQQLSPSSHPVAHALSQTLGCKCFPKFRVSRVPATRAVRIIGSLESGGVNDFCLHRERSTLTDKVRETLPASQASWDASCDTPRPGVYERGSKAKLVDTAQYRTDRWPNRSVSSTRLCVSCALLLQ